MSTGIAITVFVVAYLLIATEKIPKTAAALAGAGLVLGLGVVSSERRSTPTTPASTGTSSSCSSA